MIQENPKEITLFDSYKQLADIIDENHPLVQLADSIDWESIEEDLAEAYPSTTGHPNKLIRLMVGLHYLRYMFDLSDESIVWAYVENPYYQYFCGEKVFQHTFPIDRSSMSHFRERLKKRKLYKLLRDYQKWIQDKNTQTQKHRVYGHRFDCTGEEHRLPHRCQTLLQRDRTPFQTG